MSRISHLTATVGLVASAICTVVLLSLGGMRENVQATASTDYSSAVIQKALLRGVYRCYTGSSNNNTSGNSTSAFAIARQVDKLSAFSNFSALIIGGTSNDTIALPSGLTNITDNNVSCKVLFLGDTTGLGTAESGSFEGVFKLAGKKSYTTNKAEKIAMLEGMGYMESKASEEEIS